ESVLTATSAATAPPGTYSFAVSRLVSTQQTITRGFTDTAATALGAGTLTFEFGPAGLSADTDLRQLNGGDGVTRGKVRITDRSGASAVIDLSRALSVDDVLDAINSASGINVLASVEGDHLKLTDNTAGAGTLAVAEVAG